MNTTTKELPVQSTTPQAKRNYKDTLFRRIFSEPSELLSLYNAVNGTDYENPDELEIVTLENAIYMNVKNDLAFLLTCRLNLYEHQASVNPNMPLRNLIYVAREYERLLEERSLYSSVLVRIPTPAFVVFYNGTSEQPECRELRLSDAFQLQTGEPSLELRVRQINVNAGKNRKIMEKCPTLKEYAIYVERVRRYAGKMPLTEAVNRAVQECIDEGILKQFLIRHRAEAISMSIFEYDEEREMELIRRDLREEALAEGVMQGLERGLERGLEQGIARGKAETVIDLLNDIEPVPEDVSSVILRQTDTELLRRWNKAAAKAESLAGWKEKVGWNG